MGKAAVHEKTAKEGVQRLEDKAKRIAEAGGHHILVCLQGAPLQQVQVFLSTLRAEHLPCHIPIVVLMPPPLPKKDQIAAIFSTFPRTAFMGSLGAVSINDLKTCGMA